MKPDTSVELTPDHKVRLAGQSLATQTFTLKDLLVKTSQSAIDCYFDLTKQDQYHDALQTWDELTGFVVGASSSMPEVAKPRSSPKLSAAVQCVITGFSMLKDEAPSALTTTTVEELKEGLALLTDVRRHKRRAQLNVDNLSVAESNIEASLFEPMEHIHSFVKPMMKKDRRFATELAPLNELITGAAVEGVATRKTHEKIADKAIAKRDAEEPAPVAETPPVVVPLNAILPSSGGAVTPVKPAKPVKPPRLR